MLYVLEGCDGSGKSTLAHKLSKLLDAEIIHCSTTTPNDEVFFKRIIEASKERNIIADRWCYGQFVYQTEGNRPLADTHCDSIKKLGYLEAKMLEAGVKVILVTAPDDIIEERLALRGEVILNGLTVNEIQSRFRAVINMSMLTWLEYNTGGEEYV